MNPPTNLGERITAEAEDAWVCVCLNRPDTDGFYACLEDGTEVEPLADGPWDGRLFVCAGCGRIIDQTTLAVVGQAVA